MARIGSGGDVSIRIGTDYSGAGIDGAKKDLEGLEKTSASTSERMQSSFEKLKGAWAQVAAVYLSSRWLQSAASDALDAEIHYNKLRVQVEGLGIAFKSVEPQIQAAIAASSKYARVQDGEVSKTLQELVFHSGDYNESVRRLNLTLDLAYQKEISTSEAATIMGRAISGNTALLTRFLPELSNLDEKLGAFATEAERVSFVMAVLEEKTNGASREMTEHEKQVRDVTNAYLNVKQSVGDFLLFSASTFIQDLKKPGEAFIWLRDSIDAVAAALNPNIILTKQHSAVLMDYEKAIRLVGSAHEKTAEQLAEAIRKESEIRERIKREQEAEEQRVRVSEEQLIQLADATQRLGASKSELMAIEALAFINAGANNEQLARYNQLLLEQLEKERELALAQAAAGPEQNAQIEAYKAYLSEKQALMDAAPMFAAGPEDSPYGAHAQLEEAARLSEIANIKLQYDNKLYLLWDYNTRVIQAMVDAGANQASIEATYANLSIQTDKQMAQQKLAAYAQTAAMMSGFASNLYSALGQKQKAFFYASKAAAVAEAIINAELGAAKAVGQGGIWGIPFAAIIRTMGYANAAIIAATTFTGAGTGGGSGSSPTISSTFDSSYSPAPQRYDEKPTQAITIQIYNPLASQNWKEIVEDNIIPALNDAADRNISVTVRNM